MFQRCFRTLFAVLLSLSFVVPSASLSSLAKTAWEVGPSGPLTARDASFSEMFAERVAVSTKMNNHTVLLPVNESVGGDGVVESAWAKKAGAPWSLAASRSSPQVAPFDGVLMFELGMKNAGTTITASGLAGFELLLLLLVIPVSCCFCFFLMFDEMALGVDDRPVRNQKRDQAKASPHQPTINPRSPSQAQRQGQAASMLMQQQDAAPPAPPFVQQTRVPSAGVVAGGGSPLMSGLQRQIPSAQLPPAAMLSPTQSQGSSMPPTGTSVLSPLVAKESGEVFTLEGQILPEMQAGVTVNVSIAYNKEPYAAIHINESQMGCGVLLEMHKGNIIAFFDTQFAVGRHSQVLSLAERRVSILPAGPDGLDPVADPIAVVMPSADCADEINVFKPETDHSPAAPLLLVKLAPRGQTTRIRTPNIGGGRSKVVGMLEQSEEQPNMQQLYVYSGMDPVLILCSVVAAIKIGMHQTA